MRVFVVLWLGLLCSVAICRPDRRGNHLHTTQVEWIYRSNHLSCNSCGPGLGKAFPSFVCSNSSAKASPSPPRAREGDPPMVVSEWNSGILEFEDPIQPEVPAVIRDIKVSLNGRYDCGASGSPGDFIILMNLVSVASGKFPKFANTSLGCHCGNCGFPVSYSTGYQGGVGWTAYNRGTRNQVQVYIPAFVNQSVVCLSQVELSITWESANDTPLALNFEPHLGPLSGSTILNITGFNFDLHGEYTCFFGEQPMLGTVVSSVLIQCTSPPYSSQQLKSYSPVELTVMLLDAPISNFTKPFLYYSQPQILELTPNQGTKDTKVHVFGSGFIELVTLRCRFGKNPAEVAQFVSEREVICVAPPWSRGDPVTIPVEVSENGQDFTDDEISFTYTDIPILGSLKLWELILLIVGCAAAATVLITIVACCLYRRARSKDKSRRYRENFSDTEDETEPLISALASKSMRQILSKVERVEVSDLKIDRRIGRGSFGEVFHAYWGGTEIAIKKLPKHMLSKQKFLEDFAQEITIMAGLRHPNVLQFLGVSIDKAALFMLTEYMDRGSLYDVLHDPEQEISTDLLLRMLLDTSRGMSYLHKKFLHRDMKSHNLLVDQHWTVKICDFGLSRLKQEGNTMTACGTPCWTAPEVLRNENYTEKCDVYSFGIVIWECLTREDPYAGMPPFHVVFIVGTQGARPEIPQNDRYPQALIDLMVRAWQENPDMRPSFQDMTESLKAIANEQGQEEVVLSIN